MEERQWDCRDTLSVLKILSPFGINLVQEFSNTDDLIFKCFIPTDSKIKRSNRYVKGEAAVRLVKNAIEKHRKENNIIGSYGIDFSTIDLTWNSRNKSSVENELTNFS